MQKEGRRLLREGLHSALVPTMGFLHEGHLALMREGRKLGDVLVVSVFVNPTQFGPKEDFRTYPRDLDRDLRWAESVGTDIVFAPKAEEMYEPGHETYVGLVRLPGFLCGPSRPGHFRGVATIVAKLFNIVKPHVAIFGEKDYQQLAIIRRMARDLNMDTQIVGLPTVREPDGLAMSSRNTYLSEEDRQSALCLHLSLKRAAKMVAGGARDGATLIQEVKELIHTFAHTRIDYVSLCDPETLEDVKRVDGPTLMALAVWIGGTRLIDNAVLKP